MVRPDCKNIVIYRSSRKLELTGELIEIIKSQYLSNISTDREDILRKGFFRL